MKKKYIYIGIGLMITLMVGYLVIWGINVRSYAPYIREEDVVYSSANGYLMETEGNILYTSRSRAFLVLLEIWWGRPGMTRLVCLSGRLFLVTALMSEAYF